MIDQFIPRFSHMILLIILAAVFGSTGTLLESYQAISWILYACSLFCGLVAWRWAGMLIMEVTSARAAEESAIERANIEAVTEMARTLGAIMPPAAVAQALETCGIYISLPADDGGQVREMDGWNIRRGIPWGLCTNAQYAALAAGYHQHGLAIRWWTETQGARPPVCSRDQFERLLTELVRNGLAEKSPSGETILLQAGEQWLSRYSPTDADIQ